MITFGMRLRELRESKNLSQEALGKMLNLSQSTIAYYEKDKKQPSRQTEIKIAKIFNVSLEYLYAISETIHRPKDMDDIDPEWVELVKERKRKGDTPERARNILKNADQIGENYRSSPLAKNDE